jgi:molybdenum cofactor synthesis domain-containing protein
VRPARAGLPWVEIISVGRELLRGGVDDNAPVLARTLTRRGAVVRRITIVDDNERTIAASLREALDRNPHFVITTGGMGPAEDDRTLAAVSDALGVPLALDRRARTLVEESYQRLRREKVLTQGGLTAAREKMCRIPVGSEALVNSLGVAPGVLYRLAGGTTVLCLPGMPDEMEAVLGAALARLGLVEATTPVAQREVEAPTADEASLRPLLHRLAGEFPGVWIASQPSRSRRPGARSKIRLEARGASQLEADAMIDGVIKRLLALAAGCP